MFRFFKYYASIFALLILTISCGYKVLDKSQLFNFKLERFDTEGDNKLNFLIKNNLQKIFKNNEGNERIFLKMKTSKEKGIKEKNDSNQITKYQIKVNTSVIINNLISGTKRNLNFSVDGSYDVSNNHSTTINNQNNLEKNLAKEIADLIIRELILKNNDN